MKSYEIEVTAYALRTMRVRASTAADALAIARGRIQCDAGPWLIDFPGVPDEHFRVLVEDIAIGPNSMGEFDDGSVDGKDDYLEDSDRV